MSILDFLVNHRGLRLGRAPVRDLEQTASKHRQIVQLEAFSEGGVRTQKTASSGLLGSPGASWDPLGPLGASRELPLEAPRGRSPELDLRALVESLGVIP